MFLPRKENSSACGRVQCNPIQVCLFFFFLPFSVQSARKLSNARVLLTQRSQEVNYSRSQRHHGGGGRKRKKQHTGRLDPIMAAVKTCWSLFFGAHCSGVGLKRGVCWRTKHKRISQELHCLLEGRICFHSWFRMSWSPGAMLLYLLLWAAVTQTRRHYRSCDVSVSLEVSSLPLKSV